jgi:glycosyltransferase involved in cell wall biosynthesis
MVTTPPVFTSYDRRRGKALRTLRAFSLRWTHRCVAGVLRSLRGSAQGERLLMHWTEASFDNFLRRRDRRHGHDLSAVRCPSQPGLISIVLPVHDGGAWLAEAIDSVVAQHHAEWELIIVDDGSGDETPQIAAAAARRDPRLRIVTQPHRGLPQALNAGFRLARGQFLTWISADNRLRPDFIGRLIASLQADPSREMIYANYDLIDSEGGPLSGSDWCRDFQTPPGSNQIALPSDLLFLNMIDHNFIGPAFFYRDRALWLLGDFSPRRELCEDYDFFMRVNEALTLRRASFPDALYEYRLHESSLTARTPLGELKKRVSELLVFDDFRRDFMFSPIAWWIEDMEGATGVDRGERGIHWPSWSIGRVQEGGDSLMPPDTTDLASLPRLWFPCACVRFCADLNPIKPLETPLPAHTLKILVFTGLGEPPPVVPDEWDLCVMTSERVGTPPLLDNARRGWLQISEPDALWTALELRIRSEHIERIEQAGREAEGDDAFKVTVAICTLGVEGGLAQALESVCTQEFKRDDYEILVVNNAPGQSLTSLLDALRRQYFMDRPHHLRGIDCPVPGVSAARNAAVAEARGEIMIFIDDDAVAAPDLLATLVDAFDRHGEMGVIGGAIDLQVPDPPPTWFEPGLRKYWSHLAPEGEELIEAEDWRAYPWGCNWSARRRVLLKMGGFRWRYGRKGEDFGGAEEIVAASLASRLGFKVGLHPKARVVHRVDPRRFTRTHLGRTIQANWALNLQLELDGYIPRETSLTTIVALGWGHLRMALRPWGVSAGKRTEQLALSLASLRQAWRYSSAQWARYRRLRTGP